MRFELADSLDHALLAEAIRQGSAVANSEGRFLGRTALQKTMYFLKMSGVPLTYSFEIYHYGPFCQEIMSDTSSLLADEIIQDQSNDRDRYSKYEPGPYFEEFMEEWASKIESHREKVAQISKALAPLVPTHLELVATLDFIYRELKAARNADIPSKDSVIARFEEVKVGKFSHEQVVSTYHLMASSGMIPS